MSYSIGEIAAATGLEAAGDRDLRIERPAEPAAAGTDDLAMAMSKTYAAALEGSSARAAVLWQGADWQALGLAAALFAPRARVALAEVNDLFAPLPELAEGIHPSAVIDPTATIGPDCRIGPLTVIGAGASIGRGARILGQSTIGAHAELGADARLHPGVRIGAGVRIGERFIAQPNAVIGADGFSYVTPEPGSAETAKAHGQVTEGQNQLLRRINSFGAVTIGDDVEVGASAAIDRGTIADTTIGSGTKIDNLVQIGHNVTVGTSCLICGHVGIAGSCTIGDRVVLGGKVGIADHVTIGHDAVLAGGTMVPSNIKPRSVMMGMPAMPRDEAAGQWIALKRLPKALDQIREIREKLGL